MEPKHASTAPGAGLLRDALDNLPEPVGMLDRNLCVLFANKALLKLQGCVEEGRACRRTGQKPCDDCALAGPGVLNAARAVRIAGRAYERRSSPIGTEADRAHVVLWHDNTAGAESASALRKQYDKMRRDIFHARSIQFALLPRELTQVEGYHFASLYKPSEEMSGDIFDLIRIGRDNVAFYIADVSGHGVTAAMLTLFFSTAVRLEMRPTDMPGRVLARVHSRFMELQLEEQHYITAFLGRLELSTGKLFWSNAGHICPPVLMDAAGQVSPLEMAGLPICRWFKEQEYSTNAGRLEPGGRLVLYSDGLEAQWNASGAKGDLSGAVSSIMRQSAPEDCLEAIWKKAGAGTDTTANRDDTTLLMVSRLPCGGNEG